VTPSGGRHPHVPHAGIVWGRGEELDAQALPGAHRRGRPIGADLVEPGIGAARAPGDRRGRRWRAARRGSKASNRIPAATRRAPPAGCCARVRSKCSTRTCRRCAPRSPRAGSSGSRGLALRIAALWCEDVPRDARTSPSASARRSTSTAAPRSTEDRLVRGWRYVRAAFGPLEAHVCYAVKANSEPRACACCGALHARAAPASTWSAAANCERLRAAGLPTAGAVFAGVAKEPWEIAAAVAAGILFFNVESPHELPLLAAAGAAARRARARGAAAQSRTSTPARTPTSAPARRRTSSASPRPPRGGRRGHPCASAGCSSPATTCTSAASCARRALREALAARRSVRRRAPRARDGVTHYDLGGGFGIAYGQGEALDVGAVAAALLPRCWRARLAAGVEPGRYLVGDAGVLVTRVLGRSARAAPTSCWSTRR
jgi:hypothetical protein